jgi:tetratricopeptide (TPR) repeat protein
MPTHKRDSGPADRPILSLQPDPLVELAARLAKKASGMEESELKADLLCRLGLLCWDVLGDLEAASKYLGEAGNAHPEAVRLRLHLAISTGDQKGLQDLQREVGGELTGREVAGTFYRACAETWLFHFADTQNAASAAREGLRRNPGDVHTRAVLTLALELDGNLDGLVKHLRTASSTDEAAHRRFATVTGDLMGMGAEASKILRRLRSKAEGDPYLLERMWEIAHGEEDANLSAKDSPVALLQQKLVLLESAEGEDEKEATRFLLAQSLLTTKDGYDEANGLLDNLAETNGAWGAIVALQLKRRQAIVERDLTALAQTCWKLGARCGAPGFKRAYLIRAAELYEAEGSRERAVECYARLLLEDPGNGMAVDASERLLLRLERFRELIELYEIAARHDADRRHRLLERAAHIAESRLEDVAEASRLRRPAIEMKPEPGTLGELGRIFRGAQDLKSLQKLYGQSVSLLRDESDKRRAALYSTAAGTVALAQGDVGGADKHLSEALSFAPDDLFAHTALLGIYRRSGKWPELVGAIKRELQFEHTGPERVRLHAEIGRISLEYLKDHPLAEMHLHEAQKLNPDDPSLHHLLAQVYDAQKNYRKAVELRRKAVEGFGSSFRAAVLLCEIGESYVRHIKDDAKAEEAFQQALELDDEMEAALDALCTLYRRKGRYGDLVDMLKKRLELVDEPTEEAQVHLDLGEVAERNLRDSALALDHYRMALELDAGSALALDGLERICRQDGSWDVIAEVLEPLAGDPLARRLLYEALEHLDRWEEMRTLLTEDFDVATSAESIGNLASRLAEIYAKQFDDPAQALVWARRAVEATPTDLRRLETYRRFAEKLDSNEDLALVYERSLELLPAGDPSRPEIYRRLGRLLLSAPERLVDAARLLEQGVSVTPDDRELLDLLAVAYESMDRQDELINLLRRRAEVAPDNHDKVNVLLKAGALHEGMGASEEALEAYVGAFRLDPGNRDTFTLVERLCYRLKRWRDVMEVYETAITLVENKQSRAYRLADLYARRGQLQLQYLSQTGEAAASYLKVLQLDPGNDNSLKFLESIFSKEGDWAGLIDAYELRACTVQDL